MLEYTQGAELPDAAITWLDSSGDIIDYSSGWGYQIKVGTVGGSALFTKTTGITGAATAPNVTVTWGTAAELSTLDAGFYTVQLKATRTLDSKDRFMDVQLRIKPAIT
jgi:hypothetical protein